MRYRQNYQIVIDTAPKDLQPEHDHLVQEIDRFVSSLRAKIADLVRFEMSKRTDIRKDVTRLDILEIA